MDLSGIESNKYMKKCWSLFRAYTFPWRTILPSICLPTTAI